MSEKKDQLKEILKDQLNREAKQIEEEIRARRRKSIQCAGRNAISVEL